MADARLEVKNKEIKNIFNTMEYGNITENVDLAKAWFHKNETFYLYGSECKINILNAQTGEILAIADFSSKTREYIVNEKVSPIENCRRINKLAEKLERNSNLICQIEILARNILAKDTRKSLALLIECLQYYSGFLEEDCSEQVHNTAYFSKKMPISMLGYYLGPLLSKQKGKIFVEADLECVPIYALIIELAKEVGLTEINFTPGYIPCQIYGNFISKIANTMKWLNDGNIPMIVFNTADLDSACETSINAAWGHQGSLPWSVNTILVQEDVIEEFTKKLKLKLSKIKMGFANNKMANVSFPTLFDNYAEKMNDYIKNATLQGIEVYKAKNNDEFQPTLFIGGMVYGNNVIIEDVSLPSITILAFRNTNEAVALANNRRQGLAASVWTENGALANEVSRKLQVGIVWINSFGQFNASLSFSPQKSSGFGYFGGYEGITFKSHSFPNFSNCDVAIMTTAKKTLVSWTNQSLLNRAKKLRKFADDIDSKKASLCSTTDIELKDLENFISKLYACSTQLFYENNTCIQENYDVKSVREPVGIIGMEGSFIKYIPLALLQGNVLICITNSSFIFEISKLIPNLIYPIKINDEQTTGLYNNVYFVCRDRKNTSFITHFKPNINDVTKIKNIWSNNRESIL